MNQPLSTKLDLVDELRLRRWARLHHVPDHARDQTWHPVILDEMTRKDAELAEQDRSRFHTPIVPVAERAGLHQAHILGAPRFLASPLRIGELYYT